MTTTQIKETSFNPETTLQKSWRTMRDGRYPFPELDDQEINCLRIAHMISS